jgi:hypothetical protein
MSDTTNDPVPAEPPVNQGGGGNAPEPDQDATDEAQVAAETPVNQGGGSSAE